MKTIAGLNNKGGVGKTATIAAVSHMIAAVFKKRVIMVDMDPQGNLSQLFGFTGSDKQYSLKEAIEGAIYPVENTVEDILKDSKKNVHDCIYETDFEGLDIIPAYLTLTNVERELVGDSITPQQVRLQLQLEKIQEEYDYCFIDCGPSVSLLTMNALYASDEVLIPSKCDKDSRDGVANVIHLVDTILTFNWNGNLKLKILGCFLTQYDARKNICKEAWEDCQDALGEKFIPIPIPVNTKVEQTGSRQTPLYQLDPNGKATQQYLKLAQYIMAPNRTLYIEQFLNCDAKMNML